MKIKRKKRGSLTELEVGAFSDIAFLLIIFFILTTQIDTLTGTLAEIPSGEQAQSSEKQPAQQMVIHLDGPEIKLEYGKELKTLSLEELQVRLMEENFPAKKTQDEKYVIIDSKGEVLYDLYYKVETVITASGAFLAMFDAEESADGKGGR